MTELFFGPYRVLDSLGRGAAGEVFRAQAPTGEEVAVKVLTRRLTPEVRARFDRERALLAALPDAVGCVSFLDAGEGPHGPYLVMPLLHGGSLRDRFVREGRLEVEEALDIGHQLATALAEIHRREIVHRDLKPSNVLFDRLGEVRVADLGLAKVLHGGGGDSLSQTGALRGTLGYMPPEQMRDAKRAGTQADVFAWGAILYEALAGRPAYGGGAPLEAIADVEAGRFVPLREERPEVTPEVAKLVEDCLAGDPSQRPRDGHELQSALESACAGPNRRSSSVGLGLGLSLAVLVLGVGLGVGLASSLGPAPTPEAATGPTTTPAPETPTPVTPAPAPRSSPSPSPSPRSTSSPEDTPSRPALRGEAVATGMLGSQVGRHLSPATDVAWDASGETLASVDLGGVMRLWDPETGAPGDSFDFAGSPLHSVELHPSGDWAVVAGERGLAFVSLHPKRGGSGFPGQGRCLAAAIVGDQAVATALGGDLCLFEVPSRRLLWRKPNAHPDEGGVVSAIRYSPARREIVTGQRSVKVWSQEGDLLRSYPALSPKHVVDDLALTPSGDKIYAATHEPGLFVLDRGGSGPPERLASKRLPTSRARSLAIAPDGSVLSGHQNGALLQRSPGGERLLGRHSSWIHGLRLGPRGLVATASNDRTVAVFSLAEGRPIWQASGHRGVRGASGLMSSGSEVYSSGSDGVRIWSLATGAQTKHLPSQARRLGGVPNVLVLSPDGRLLVRSTPRGLAITRLEKGQTSLWTPPGTQRLTGVAFAKARLLHITLDSGKSLFMGVEDPGASSSQEPSPRLRGQSGWLALRYLRSESAFLVVHSDRIELSSASGSSEILRLPFAADRANFDRKGVAWVAAENRFLGVVSRGPQRAAWSVDLTPLLPILDGNPSLGPRQRFVAFKIRGEKVGVFNCSDPEKLRRFVRLSLPPGHKATSLDWSDAGELLIATNLGPILRYRLR